LSGLPTEKKTDERNESATMLILMKPQATAEQIYRIKEKIDAMGYEAHEIPGATRIAIGITGNEESLLPDAFMYLDGVEEAVPVTKPYKLVGRHGKVGDTVIAIDGVAIGGKELVIMAGPCSVESREQLSATARAVKNAGATVLRGGAFKPRTSPYAFQGLKEQGLMLLQEARRETGLKIVTEVKDIRTLGAVNAATDILQIGARNMSNFSLLEAVGELRTPILLKRGISATLEELLMAAEYIVARGNTNVILCERGIRTFEPSTRFTLDLNAVPMLKKQSHLPVIVDPSHGIGIADGVPAMAMAAIAAGADGLIVEVHPDPATAKSDGGQSLKPETFATLMDRLRMLAPCVDRTLTKGNSI